MLFRSNAIAHVLYGGNTLLAHEVGAGKTFEMASLVGADWESLSSVQFVPKDGTLCAPGSEFALYGLKR